MFRLMIMTVMNSAMNAEQRKIWGQKEKTNFHEETLRLEKSEINLLKTKRKLFYIRNQSVPRSKHTPSQLYKPVS